MCVERVAAVSGARAARGLHQSHVEAGRRGFRGPAPGGAFVRMNCLS